MRIRVLPETGWPSQLRLGVLLALLIGAVWLSLALRKFEREFRSLPEAWAAIQTAAAFENLAHLEHGADSKTIELHSRYFRSMLAQMSILGACADSWTRNGTIPSTRADLIKAHVSPESLWDPWGREYRVRLLHGDFLIVQSTGPSGHDSIPADKLSEPDKYFGQGPRLIGDNLVVGLQLSNKSEFPVKNPRPVAVP
jgi:hypothetical protein